MKELKVLMAVYLLCIGLLIACTKVQSVPVIELGKESQINKINYINPPITTGKVELSLAVTKGAKYSIQLIDLKGDVKSATGFTADSDLILKTLDYSDINSGDYIIDIIDIFGKEYKANITIKH